MSDEHRQLLERITASRQFIHADALKRILMHICTSTSDPAAPSVREHDIAVNAIGRPASFDPKTDPIVRVSVASIRERLRSYFETDGRHEAMRLEIPKGQYRAVYVGANGDDKAEVANGLMKFWRRHLGAASMNTFVYAELLFYRDEHGNFIRNMFVNDTALGAAALRDKLPNTDVTSFRPSHHFVSAGEMHCLMSIGKMLLEFNARMDVRTTRFCSWNDVRDSNLILLGNARINKFVDALQGDQCFYLTDDHIVNRSPQPGEPAQYRGHRYTEGKLERVTEYAVITRRPGLSSATAVTMITANHGRAIEAAGFFLSREDALRDLLERMGVAPAAALPDNFQVLLKVELIDFDEDLVNVEYVTHRLS